jgi:hypothetical protein
MRRYIALIVAVSIVSMSLQGCASMFHGTTQQIGIRSNVSGTEIYANEAYVGKDNGVTAFHKNQNYTITARKVGCDATTVPVSKSFDAITLLGIFVYFIPIIIDGATGAWQEFDQTSYVVDPHCS